MDLSDLLAAILQKEEAKEELAEALISDLISQLDVLDPVDDSDELIEFIISAIDSEDPTAQRLIEFLLGVKTLDEWLEPFVEPDSDE